MADNWETCNDFCDVGRYSSVIWTCQHLTGAFEKTFEIQTIACLLV